jgi:hypothetical protein
MDTEFNDFEAFQLVSLAIVGEDGREFYGGISDFQRPLFNAFVRDKILPQLDQFPGRSIPFRELSNELSSWLAGVPMKPKPVLCFDFDGDLDLVNHLLGGPCHEAGKRKMSRKGSMLEDLPSTSTSTAASITRYTMRVRTTTHSFRFARETWPSASGHKPGGRITPESFPGESAQI